MLSQGLFFPFVQLDALNSSYTCYQPQQVGVISNGYLPFTQKVNRNKKMLMTSLDSNNIIPRQQPYNYGNNPTKFHKHEVSKLDTFREAAPKLKKHSKYYIRDKRKACWHFLRGYCERGDSCHFRHNRTDAAYQSQKVFLPGLPQNITEVALRKQLHDEGCNVINKVVSLHKSWPRVYLGSPEEAQMLYEKGRVSISGYPVEVRPWQAVAEKQRKRIADINRRSIFLGGLPEGITWQMIRASLDKVGGKVTNLMRVKRGFCPKVTLATDNQAFMLISAGKVEINGCMVDVRPYVPKSSFKGPVKQQLE